MKLCDFCKSEYTKGIGILMTDDKIDDLHLCMPCSEKKDLIHQIYKLRWETYKKRYPIKSIL